jgi:hypothetical protein
LFGEGAGQTIGCETHLGRRSRDPLQLGSTPLTSSKTAPNLKPWR